MAAGAHPFELDEVGAHISALGVEPSDRILSAVSGGADSASMLWALVRLGYETEALHVDHCLRADSSRDAEAAAAICESLGVELHVHRERPDVAEGSSPETEARKLRYLVLEKMASELGATWIATGHTLDDQIETFFVNLMRGGGLDGLAGIPPVRGKLIRPLVNIRRADVRARATAERLPFVDDPTNAMRSYLRNRIRLDLLPLLDELSDGRFATSMRRQFGYLRDDARYVNALADSWLEANARPVATGQAIALPLTAMRDTDVVLQRRVIRRGMCRLGIASPPQSAHVDRVLSLESGAGDLGGGLMGRVEGDYLVLRPSRIVAPSPVGGVIPGTVESPESGIKITATEEAVPEHFAKGTTGVGWVSLRAAGRVELRTPRPGERFSPQGMSGTKPLTDFLAGTGVCRTEREIWPVIARPDSDGGEIIWVVGKRVSEDFAIGSGEGRGIRLESSSIGAGDD